MAYVYFLSICYKKHNFLFMAIIHGSNWANFELELLDSC